MSWTSFKEAAKKSLGEKGISAQLQDSLVMEAANQILAEIIGQDAKDKARAIYLKSQILTIAVLSDDILGIIRSTRQEFLNKLNSRLNDNVVQDIKFLN
ncbi:MAG: DUF721 domain-containing protein [Candidatus Omnitrophica bacterium]|nr:DUF721 domain-containing protein [Candidatus Omnitrophota bacterium]